MDEVSGVISGFCDSDEELFNGILFTFLEGKNVEYTKISARNETKLLRPAVTMEESCLFLSPSDIFQI